MITMELAGRKLQVCGNDTERRWGIGTLPSYRTGKLLRLIWAGPIFVLYIPKGR